MNSKIQRAIFLILILTLLNLLSYSDILIVNNSEIWGKITSEVDNSLFFLTSTGEIKFDKNKIKEIIREDETMNLYRLGDVEFDRKNFEKAIEYYHQALKKNPELVMAQNKIELANTALDILKKEEEKKRLEEITQRIRNAEKMIEEEKFADALLEFDKLKQLNPTQSQLEEIHSDSIKLHYNWAIDYLDKLQKDSAIEQLKQVLKLDPQNKDTLTKLNEIYQSDSRYSDMALENLLKELEKNKDDKSLNEKVADIYYLRMDYINAFPYIEKVYLLSEKPKGGLTNKLRKCLDVAINKAIDEKQFNQAKEYLNKFYQYFPEEPKTKYYLTEYFAKANTIDPNNTEERFQLAKFCIEHNLDSQALKELRLVLNADSQHTGARNELEKYAFKEYLKITELYNLKKYTETMQAVQEFLKNFPDSNIVSRANDLYASSEIKLTEEVRKRKEQAQKLADTGDEAYAKGDQHLNMLVNKDINYISRRRASDINEAVKWYQVALNAYAQALELDQSLGDINSRNLKFKMADIQEKISRLINPPERQVPLRPLYR